MKLLIISHTNHYVNTNNTLVGWGPTVTEINELAPHFDTIYHIAFFFEKEPPPSALPYNQSNIEFIPIKPSGGPRIGSKFSILINAPNVLSKVKRTLKKVDAFQLRCPIGMGVYLIPYLTYFSRTKGWYKYAGNWNQSNAPLGYRLQRYLLSKQRRTITINGVWPEQPKHSLSFENPCLTKEERKIGLELIQKKSFKKPYTFCFVGRLENEKGVQRILDAFKSISWNKDQYTTIHFVGDSNTRPQYEQFASNHNIRANFHGFLSRGEVFELFKHSDFLLLPSTASEGFPKVIAEAMNFGCIPVVSSVSSISQYITKNQGFVLDDTSAEGLKEKLQAIMKVTHEDLRMLVNEGYQVSKLFTFQHYNFRILNEILK